MTFLGASWKMLYKFNWLKIANHFFMSHINDEKSTCFNFIYTYVRTLPKFSDTNFVSKIQVHELVLYVGRITCLSYATECRPNFWRFSYQTYNG